MSVEQNSPRADIQWSAIAFAGRGIFAGHDSVMKTAQRGYSTLYPMPVRLNCPATLRVSDDTGRLVRREELAAGTHPVERLRSAHETYQQQGWTVSALRS